MAIGLVTVLTQNEITSFWLLIGDLTATLGMPFSSAMISLVNPYLS
jgi:hypothetical protein